MNNDQQIQWRVVRVSDVVLVPVNFGGLSEDVHAWVVEMNGPGDDPATMLIVELAGSGERFPVERRDVLEIYRTLPAVEEIVAVARDAAIAYPAPESALLDDLLSRIEQYIIKHTCPVCGCLSLVPTLDGYQCPHCDQARR